MSDTSHLRSVLVMGASVVALAAFAAPAMAQTAAPAAPAAGPEVSGGADVIVTAEHRQTRLQKVPVAVSVFTGAQRDRVGISTVQDVTNFAPGFVYDPANVHAYIRGVGRQSINVTNDSRVTAYEDEFFVYSPYQLAKSSLFLTQEQIERGPQNVGGRNAAGGSIDMISVRPTDTPYAEVRGTIGNFQTYNFEAAASGPVLPGLNVRIDGFDHNQNQGYYKNLVLPGQTEGNEIHEWYAEAQADWKITPDAELYVRGFASGWNDRGDAGARTGYASGHWDETNLTDGNTYAGGGLFVNPNFGYADPALGLPAAAGRNPADPQPFGTTLAVPGIFDNPALNNRGTTPKFAEILPRTVHLAGYNGIQANFTYHFPSFDFKNIVGEQGYNYSLDFSEPDTNVTSFKLPGSTGPCAALGSPFNCPTTFGAIGLGGILPAPSALTIFPLVDLHYQEYDHWGSDEFSIQSTTSSPFQYTAGVFIYHQQYGNPISARALQQPNLDHPLAAVPGFPFATSVAAAPNPHRYLFFQGYKINDDSEAGYVQLSYKLNDAFKITGNIRYTNDHKYGNEEARYVFFGSSLIDGLSPFFGSATPSLDITTGPGGLTCPTGVRASCASGPLAKGVTSIGIVNPNNGIIRRNIGDSSGALTGGAGIEYSPTPDTFMYARYSRGYEDFSFNAGYVSPTPEVAPEFLNSYEVGYKQSFGRTISIDTALFYYDYQNFQLPIAVANGGTIQTTFVNVPKAQSTGIEFEGTWTPTRDLLFSLSYSLDYTQILSQCTIGATHSPNPGAFCMVDTNDPAAVAPGARPAAGQLPFNATTNPGINQSVKGDALPNAPRNKIAITGSYTWHFDPGNFTLTGSYAWRDVQYGTAFRRNYDAAPAWDDFDLRAQWSGDHDRYEVIGYVRNVFDTKQYSNGVGGAGLLGTNATHTTAAAGLNEVNVYELVAPRTFGVEVRYKFF